jgi:hypothetical protein
VYTVVVDISTSDDSTATASRLRAIRQGKQVKDVTTDTLRASSATDIPPPASERHGAGLAGRPRKERQPNWENLEIVALIHAKHIEHDE